MGEQNNCWAWDGHRGRDHRRKRAEQYITAIAYHIKNNASATCWSQIGKNDFWNPHDELRSVIQKVYRASGFGGKTQEEAQITSNKRGNSQFNKVSP